MKRYEGGLEVISEINSRIYSSAISQSLVNPIP
jgi:hypothetical protein